MLHNNLKILWRRLGAIMVTVYTLLFVLAAQAETATVVADSGGMLGPPPTSWISFFERGGPWAIVICLIMALIFLWREYTKSKDNEAAILKQWNVDAREWINKTSEATSKTAEALATVTAALSKVAERQWRIERVLHKRDDDEPPPS